MCVKFTGLNKAYPKDCYPLPCINQLVDATSSHALLSFMDAYFGYNQIKMDPTDEDKTAFFTDDSVYCYKCMPFGLKNAGTTYQGLANRIVKHKLGRNVEAYVDHMSVKYLQVDDHSVELKETFDSLFKDDSCKLLGYIIT